ncbi:MAG TPA: tetratricopeptide repeat protein [Gaiellaceae bacterium]
MESTAALPTLPPVTPAFMRTASVPGSGRAETTAALAQAERYLAAHRYEDALEALSSVHVPSTSAPDLALRVLQAETWARLYLGDVELADSVAERARALSEGTGFSDLERAESLFHLGCCRLKLTRVTNAVSLFTLALRLSERTGVEGDRLRAQAFEWRSRCYQLQREWEAAESDAHSSVELAQQIGDGRLEALAQMQCSLVTERRGDPLLARFYAERARALAIDNGDRQTEARIVNNLGGLSYLLGEPQVAVAYLKEAFALSLEIGNDADAAQAVSSLAQVHLRCGAPQLAEEQARHALSILDERADFVDERGNVHLVLGRALLDQEREDEAIKEFAAAEWLFESLGSASHVAAAWMAQGDLYSRKGDLEAATALYRRAAEALQDFNF